MHALDVNHMSTIANRQIDAFVAGIAQRFQHRGCDFTQVELRQEYTGSLRKLSAQAVLAVVWILIQKTVVLQR